MAKPARMIRFGAFEADLATGQLRKNGTKIKIQEMPFRLLMCLLERPGEVVTRDELRQKLWAEDEFVEFEHSLNTAVNKLRTALGDHADQPRYIETIPRRGYRFVGMAEGSVGGPAPVAPRRGVTQVIPWVVMGVAVAVAVVAVVLWRSQSLRKVPQPKLTQLTRDTGLTYQPALSRDGKLLAYASDRAGEGGLDIWMQQIGGGEPIQLTSDDSDDYEPHFSPDGTKIAFRSDRSGGGVYVVSALGGEPPRLIAGEGRRPRYSPDGEWIAFWVGTEHYAGGEAYVVPSSGGPARRLETEAGSNVGRSPVWSPDSSHLLVSRGSRIRGERDWWIIPRDGGDIVKTGAFDVFRSEGLSYTRLRRTFIPSVWDSGSNHIIFSARLGDVTNVWQVPVSPKTWKITEPPEKLTLGTGVEAQASLVAGGRLVFASLLQNFDVWGLPIDAYSGEYSGDLVRLTDNTADDVHPRISADGNTLWFDSNRAGTPDIWTTNLVTGKVTMFTAAPAEERDPVTSPDGSKVAYNVLGESYAIHAAPVSGGSGGWVCDDCGVIADWSQDGKHILSYSYPRLFLVDADSGEKRTLLECKLGERHPFDPRFSRDGKWISFHFLYPWAGEVRRQIFITPFRDETIAEESEWIAVTDESGVNNCAVWSSDGNLLYFLSEDDGFRCIRAQRLNPATKRLVGAPIDIYHSHQARQSLMNVPSPGTVGLSAARDKLVFAMGEVTGNIWMAERGEK